MRRLLFVGIGALDVRGLVPHSWCIALAAFILYHESADDRHRLITSARQLQPSQTVGRNTLDRWKVEKWMQIVAVF
eukprot:scaffold381236_cov22-Prasinocladus_malaysianus.AAC.1